MIYLSVDFETRSAIDLTKTGVYRYAEDASTDVWCMAWALGEAEPSMWRPGDPVPALLDAWVRDGSPLRAWNAQVERTIWNEILVKRYQFSPTTREQWFCTAAEARAMALPGKLADAAIVLGVEEQKDAAGSRLMMQMAKPRRTLPDGRFEWWATADRMQRLMDYCRQDVRTERAVFQQIRPLAERERNVFLLDQGINDRGVLIDQSLALAAKDVAAEATKAANARLLEITKGKAKSVTDIGGILTWLRSQGVESDSLDKASVAEMKTRKIGAEALEVLTIREELGKTSVKKIDSMLGAACADGRVRGTLLFHGAATGRWAGRLVQPQNFPRGNVENPEQYIPAVLSRSVNEIDLHHPPLEVVSALLRAMLHAGPGNELVAADFSAIEARVIAWMAGEQWRLEVFATHGQIYEASASMMFGVPWSEFQDYIDRGKKHPLRAKGKVSELALGFQGGVGALQAMGAEKEGLTIEEMQDSVKRWRAASPNIVKLWAQMERAALAAVEEPGSIHEAGVGAGRVKFKKSAGFLWMLLPSGRRLAYAKPHLIDKITPWGKTVKALAAWGQNSVTKRWQQTDLYGGILTENAVQAIAADLLFEAMMRVEAAGMPIIMSVHDEIVCEVPKGRASAEELERVMSIAPVWATGLPLAAEGWVGERFKK